jgi:hypothetical protein
MLFFWNQKCSLFEKNALFSGTNHDLGSVPESERKK